MGDSMKEIYKNFTIVHCNDYSYSLGATISYSVSDKGDYFYKLFNSIQEAKAYIDMLT